MSTMTLPQQILDLRAKLASSDFIVRVDAAADAVGLPRYEQIPRPGAAAGWSIKDWLEWGKPWGFREGERSTHAHRMEHPAFPEWICAPASTPGDFRGPMRCATDFRRMGVEVLDDIAYCMSSLIDRMQNGALDGFTIGEESGTIVQQLAAAVCDIKNRQSMLNRRDVTGSGIYVSDADGAAWHLIPGLFKTLQREFDIHPRSALNAIGFLTAEKFLEVMKLPNVKPAPGSAPLLYQLRGLLEAKRAEVKVEEEDKRQRREAERAEREAEKLGREKAREPGSEEKYRAAIARTKLAVNSHIISAWREVEKVAAGLKRAAEVAESHIPYPDYPGAPVELLAQIAELQQKVQEQEAAAAAVSSAMMAMQLECGAVRREKEAAETLLAEAQNAGPWRSRCAELVQTVKSHLAGNDLFSLASGVVRVREAAERIGSEL